MTSNDLKRLQNVRNLWGSHGSRRESRSSSILLLHPPPHPESLEPLRRFICCDFSIDQQIAAFGAAGERLQSDWRHLNCRRTNGVWWVKRLLRWINRILWKMETFSSSADLCSSNLFTVGLCSGCISARGPHRNTFTHFLRRRASQEGKQWSLSSWFGGNQN